MTYNPFPEKIRQVREAFANDPSPIDGLLEQLDRFGSEPSVPSAVDLLTLYFDHHVQGDIKRLRWITSVFADKRAAMSLVDSVLNDEELLGGVASRSYPHPIGFDKLVLHHRRHKDRSKDFKLRLHVYWRTPQELATERIHLHRFEMASSPITGELTNHLYSVGRFDGDRGIAVEDGVFGPKQKFYVYTGFERDAKGVLHRRFIGEADLVRTSVRTFVPGQTYAQTLEAAHFVETNAETGHTNGDVCSTIYVHGPSLLDAAGRSLPLLFEEERVPDETVETIPSLTTDRLIESLGRYRSLLSESLRFYDWLYDSRYGRNLSVGMIAGYFLSEAFGTDQTIEMWEKHRPACEDVLHARAATLEQLVDKRITIDDLPQEDRTTRYFQQLINKSYDHREGPKSWISSYGNLVKELERYLGALIGDYARNPKIKVLKPIWELSSTSNLKGGAHYGHIGAMLEGVRCARPIIAGAFRSPNLQSKNKGDEGPVSEVDVKVQRTISAILGEHFPGVRCIGEESVGQEQRGATTDPDRRWLVDPIDGTRNFLHGNKAFAVSIAHQRRIDGRFVTTDAVVALPAQGEIYWAELDKGAFLIDRDGREQRLFVPKSSAPTLEGRLVDLSVRGLGPKAELALTDALIRARAVRRATGCAAWMLSMVSGTGNAGAIATAEEYDVAAGLLVAREAGAKLVTRELERDGRTFVAYVVGESEPIAVELDRLVEQALAQ